MAEDKKIFTDGSASGLKKANNKKANIQMGADVFKGQGLSSAQSGSGIKVKKKLPLWVDIIAGILMFVIVCGIVVGSYMLFRHYSNDYAETDVTYTVIVDGTLAEEIEKYYVLKDGELFMDTEDNSVYFGKITKVSEKNERILLTVSAQAKHRNGEGYSLGESRLAVGSEFDLRCDETNITVEVVALKTGGK